MYLFKSSYLVNYVLRCTEEYLYLIFYTIISEPLHIDILILGN